MASTYLRLTGQTPTNNKKFTYSGWIKKTNIASYSTIFYCENTSNTSYNFRVWFRNNDVLEINDYALGTVMKYTTNQLFRDTSAWYHIVIAVDTTNATANDRTKLWINGEQINSFSTQTTYSLNDSTQVIQSGYNCDIGVLGGSNYFDGSMAHVHFIDGTAYDSSTFGETDATTGIWKPKTAPSVTYGTNGFFLKFENSGAFGTDSSGNGNNFTVNGTMTQTIDTPSNVFATLNTLFTGSNNFTFENGNTTVTTSVSDYKYAISTLGMSSGKYYVEVKNVNHPSNPNNDHYNRIGIASGGTVPSSLQYLGVGAYEYGIREDNGNVSNNNGSTAYGVGYSTDGDIVGCALDLDNNKIYWSKNGTWMNSADPSAGTGGFSITAPASTDSGFYHFAVGEGGSSLSSKFSINFGNGYFGTTAVASAQNPDDGIGIFEYSVPTGYKALCTKSINAQEYD